MKTISVTIDAPTLARVDRLAASGTSARKGASRSIDRSRVVQLALVEFLRRHEREQRDRAALAAYRDRLALQAAILVEEQRER